MSATPDPGRLIDLGGRTALVTGGSGGIGRAVVALLGAAGASVFSVDRPDREAPPGVRGLACDLADPGAIRALFAASTRPFGRLHVLVHCAGITRDAVLWKMEDAAWSDVLRVNLESAFHLLKHAAPLMRETGECAVVLVSSINGERGKFGQANYAASKAGLIGLARTAARELGRFGIRVNVIAPGFIETEMTAGLPPDVRARALDETALGRVGRPEDVARAALYLCSPLSAHVTGQVLRVDGGQLMA